MTELSSLSGIVLAIEGLEVGDDVAGVVGSGVHVGHERVAFVEGPHAALIVDRRRVGDEALEELRVLRANHLGEVRSRALGVTGGASEAMESSFPANGWGIVRTRGRREDCRCQQDRGHESYWDLPIAQPSTVPQRLA